LEYAVDGLQVIWTDPRLVLTDVVAGSSMVLDRGPAAAPAISRGLIAWSGPKSAGVNEYGIHSYDRANAQHRLLVAEPGNQRQPVLTDQQLVWQSEEDGRSRLRTAGVAEALAAAPAVATTEAGAVVADGVTASFTRPTYKGVHAPNAQGWQNADGATCVNGVCAAIDALGAPTEPYFGSYIVLNSDLGRATGRTAPWGPTVADAMRHMQTT
jgi:hypothetical protein